jgi:hypothetical protein
MTSIYFTLRELASRYSINHFLKKRCETASYQYAYLVVTNASGGTLAALASTEAQLLRETIRGVCKYSARVLCTQLQTKDAAQPRICPQTPAHDNPATGKTTSQWSGFSDFVPRGDVCVGA